MITADILAKRIRATGFACTGCGSCCRHDGKDPGIVMVSCGEIRNIAAATGRQRDAIVQPYPEEITDNRGGRYTLGWCLRQEKGRCLFHAEGRCAIYAARPWICRTYPFMLDGDDLVVSECEGCGRQVARNESLQIARDLVRRRKAEEDDAREIRRILIRRPPPAGTLVVVDAEGMKVIDG